jgi:alkanesulfonate monooxygenase
LDQAWYDLTRRHLLSLRRGLYRCPLFQQPRIPIYFGGASDAAIDAAGKHADVYALWGETYDQVRELTARVRAAAARHDRTVRFSLSLRPILAPTENEAWARADRIKQRIAELCALLTGARGNTTSLVGTPLQVAEALVDYYDLGVTTFLIRGFDPLDDAIDYGRELLPLTKQLIVQRATKQVAA